MNLVDAFVKKVISGPYKEYGKWWIDVEYISWGVPGKTRLMFESKEQALEVKEGIRRQLVLPTRANYTGRTLQCDIKSRLLLPSLSFSCSFHLSVRTYIRDGSAGLPPPPP